MSFTSIRLRAGLLGALAVSLGVTAGLAQAQSNKVAESVAEQTRAEQAAQQSQQRVTKLDEETTGIVAEYRQLIAEAQSLKTYNEQLALQVKSQNDELTSMTQQIQEIETTSREVLPMMTRMLDTLEQFVKLDVPFLPEERNNRVVQLKDMMTRADVSLSEKYRRIVEAYQVEMEYGRTIEAYQGKVGEKTVEFLRAGRVALLYQTLDGLETGYWDVSQKAWVVDNSYGDAITEGLKVAKKQAAPDFLTVPVPAPKEIQ